MKNLLFAICFLFAGVCGFAQYADNVGSSDSLVIIKEEAFFDDDMTRMIKKVTAKRYFEPHWAGFEMGFNCYGTNNFTTSVPDEYSQMEQNVGNSLAYNLNIFDIGKNFGRSKIGAFTGIGLTWNNYRFNDKKTLLYTENSKLAAVHDSSAARNYVKSKLNILWLRVPLMLEWQNGKDDFAKAVYVSAGIVGAVKLNAHTKQKFDNETTNGMTKVKTSDDFYLSAFKADLELHVGLGPIRIFMNYGLTQMFQKGKGPELYPWTIGLTLINF